MLRYVCVDTHEERKKTKKNLYPWRIPASKINYITSPIHSRFVQDVAFFKYENEGKVYLSFSQSFSFSKHLKEQKKLLQSKFCNR